MKIVLSTNNRRYNKYTTSSRVVLSTNNPKAVRFPKITITESEGLKFVSGDDFKFVSGDDFETVG